MAIDVTKLNRKQLNALRNKIESREEEMNKNALKDLRARISAMVKDEGFTMDEVFGRRSKRASKRTGKVPPKYQNPSDPGQTWSGRGKRPRWFNAALKSGKKEKDLLIK
ncbi:MAG: H-NS histone family protein [Rhodanobacteraceae bacterium]